MERNPRHKVGIMNRRETRENLAHLYNLSLDALEKLRLPMNLNGCLLEHLFVAGKNFDGSRDYSRYFSRDAYISGLLMANPDLVRDFLIFNSFMDGKTVNPETSEEPGEPPHEWPGVVIRGKNTQFCASDVAQLDLIACADYFKQTRDIKFLSSHKEVLERRTRYLLAHLNEKGLFLESPEYVGLTEFPLPATYFRDWGILRESGRKRFFYPVSYLLVQAQTVAALRSLRQLSQHVLVGVPEKTLERLEQKALSSLLTVFWDTERERFFIAKDERGPIRSEYADPLHMLFYLKTADVPSRKLSGIWEIARGLSSSCGIATYRRKYLEKDKRVIVWPFEQAIFTEIGLRFGQKQLVRDAVRIIDCLASLKRPFTEYVLYDDFTGKTKPGGCEIQLWTIAAIHYFWRKRNQIFLS